MGGSFGVFIAATITLYFGVRNKGDNGGVCIITTRLKEIDRELGQRIRIYLKRN
jgi:hypothetical protein